MKKLRFFELNFGSVLLRFYLMMAVIIIAGFSGHWLFAMLALPIFISIMLGVSFKGDDQNGLAPSTINRKVVGIHSNNRNEAA